MGPVASRFGKHFPARDKCCDRDVADRAARVASIPAPDCISERRNSAESKCRSRATRQTLPPQEARNALTASAIHRTIAAPPRRRARERRGLKAASENSSEKRPLLEARKER